MKNLFKVYNKGNYLVILKIAFPLLLINASMVVMQLTDRKFLSMLSNEHLAAALPSGALAFTLGCLLLSTVAFATPMVAHAFGGQKTDACVSITWSALWFALFSGIITFLFITPIGKVIIYFFDGENETILNYELAYYTPLMQGYVFLYLSTALSSFFSGRGITWIPSIVQAIVCAVNIFFNYLFIFGNGGMPRLEMAGAAYGTVISSAVGTLLLLIFFLGMNQKEYPTRKIRGWVKEHWIIILKKGLPSGGHVFTDLAAFTLFIFWVGSLGIVSKTSCTIAFSLNMIAFSPMLGLNEAACILVGQYYGKKMLHKAQEIGFQVIQMAWSYCTCIGLIYLFLGPTLILFFKPIEVSVENFSEIAQTSYHLLGFIGIYCFCDAMIFVCSGAMRGAGYTQKPMLLVGLGHWLVWMPGTTLLAFFQANLYIIWGYMTLYLMTLAFSMFQLYRRGTWQKSHIYKEESPVYPSDLPA